MRKRGGVGSGHSLTHTSHTSGSMRLRRIKAFLCFELCLKHSPWSFSVGPRKIVGSPPEAGKHTVFNRIYDKSCGFHTNPLPGSVLHPSSFAKKLIHIIRHLISHDIVGCPGQFIARCFMTTSPFVFAILR